VLKPECAEIASHELLDLTGASANYNEENITRIAACLEAIKRLEVNGNDKLVVRLKTLIEDFRVPIQIRVAALQSLPGVCPPTPTLIEFLVKLYERDAGKFEGALVQVPSAFAKKCKQDVDYVLSCVSEMGRLLAVATKLHGSISSRSIVSENELKVSDLREGIQEIESIISAFEEYIANPSLRRPAAGAKE